jgi:deoxycytidine triphosphate deaminase
MYGRCYVLIDWVQAMMDLLTMKPIGQKEFGRLRRQKLAVCHPLNFLDEHKIALHLHPMMKVLPEQVDASSEMDPNSFSEIDVREATLLPGCLYLGFSTQHISLPSNVWGLLHTRSTLARLGLDFFGSSYYVSPGFGAETPTQIVYELRVSAKTKGIPVAQPVAGLLLFESEVSKSLWRGKGKHALRFPFSKYIPR